MQTLNTIERVDQFSPAALWNDYTRRRRPVIVARLLESSILGRLDTPERALAELADMPLVIQEEPTASYFAGRRYGGAAPERTTFAAFLDALRTDRGASTLGTTLGDGTASSPPPGVVPITRRVVRELEAPAALRRLYDTPAICRGPIEPHTIAMAGAGDVEHLHYDLLPSHQLIVQVFGRTRHVLVPTEAAFKTSPILNLGSALLSNMTEPDKLTYLRYLGADDCLLEPGEALIVPMASWHHAEYLETSLACSIRFGESAPARRLIEQLGGRRTIHRNHYAQAIVAQLTDELAVARCAPVLDELERALAAADDPDPMQRYLQRNTALLRAYAALDPAAAATPKHHYLPLTRYLNDLIAQLLAHPELL